MKTVKYELDTVMGTSTEAGKKGESKMVKSENWASQYLSVYADKTKIEKLKSDAKEIRECIFKLSSDEDFIWRLKNLSATAQEECRRAVCAEKNLTSVSIDLGVTDRAGRPNTCES